MSASSVGRSTSQKSKGPSSVQIEPLESLDEPEAMEGGFYCTNVEEGADRAADILELSPPLKPMICC